MSGFWMVRAGSGGYLADHFEKQSCIAIGFVDCDLTQVRDEEELRNVVLDANPEAGASALKQMSRFRFDMQKGDGVISYDASKREYLVGKVTGDYSYERGRVPDHPHIRCVEWRGRISRDDLSPETRNTLGAWATITKPGQEIYEEIDARLQSKGRKPPIEEVGEDGNGGTLKGLVEQSHELIKDRVLKLDWEQMQDLVAAILRAMGYQTLVSSPGPDMGKDIVASPDGLGLAQPRIKVQVKHRPKHQIGAPEIKSFLGALIQSDKGLYVSTGGYTKEARVVADGSPVPLTLLDLDRLASLLVQHYGNLDSEGRALVPLVPIFWPAQ